MMQNFTLHVHETKKFSINKEIMFFLMSTENTHQKYLSGCLVAIPEKTTAAIAAL